MKLVKEEAEVAGDRHFESCARLYLFSIHLTVHNSTSELVFKIRWVPLRFHVRDFAHLKIDDDNFQHSADTYVVIVPKTPSEVLGIGTKSSRRHAVVVESNTLVEINADATILTLLPLQYSLHHQHLSLSNHARINRYTLPSPLQRGHPSAECAPNVFRCLYC